jgi:hypothetical protein
MVKAKTSGMKKAAMIKIRAQTSGTLFNQSKFSMILGLYFYY